jgi:hypothetical protein
MMHYKQQRGMRVRRRIIVTLASYDLHYHYLPFVECVVQICFTHSR